jgi:hypothetical protein
MNNTKANSFDYPTIILSFSLIITITALIGNSTVLYILRLPEFKNKSLFKYLFVATIFDTINALYTWIFNYQEFFFINKNVLCCKLIHYFGHVTFLFNPWINVLISMDTYGAVKFPTKFQFRNTHKFQIKIIVCTFICLFLANIPYLIYLNIIPAEGCATQSVEEAFYLNLYFTILLILVPAILMISTNCLIFYQLVSIRRNSNKNNYNDAVKLLRVSLGMNLFFLFTYFPYRLSMIINMNFPFIVYVCLFFLESVYNSFNFIIYIISNRLFRERCKSFIKIIQM